MGTNERGGLICTMKGAKLEEFQQIFIPKILSGIPPPHYTHKHAHSFPFPSLSLSLFLVSQSLHKRQDLDVHTLLLDSSQNTNRALYMLYN